MLKNNKIVSIFLSVLMLLGTLCGNLAIVSAQEEEISTGIAYISVTDSNGNPLSNLSFTVREPNGATAYFSGSSGIYSYGGSDSNVVANSGFIRLENVPSGTYTIYYNNNDSNYEFDSASIVVSAGRTEYNSIQARNVIGSVSIYLTGENGSGLSGARFHISSGSGTLRFSGSPGSYSYNMSGNDVIETGYSGQIFIDSLPAGTYTLVQDTLPESYNAGLGSQQFTIYPQQTANVAVVNSREYGTVNITSKDDKGSSAEITVTISDNNGPVSFYDYGSGSYVVADAGAGATEITISDRASFSQLPFGEYAVDVVSKNDKYGTPERQYFSIYNTGNQEINFVSELKELKVTLAVEDEDGKPVSGYKFKVIDENKKPVSFKYTERGEYEYNANGTSEDLETLDTGRIILSNLPEGSYKFQEVETSGYKFNKWSKAFTVKRGESIELDFTATKSVATIKLSSDGKLKAANVTVKLLDASNKTVFEGKTDSAGSIALNDVPDGKYTYLIESMPSGFVNKKYRSNLTIDSTKENQDVDIPIEEMSIKVNTGTPGDTVVLINNSTGKETKAIVGDDGTVTFRGVEDGEYSIRYNDSTEFVTIDRNYMPENFDFSDGNTAVITPSETEKPESSIIQKVKSIGILPLALICLAILAIIGIITAVVLSKKKDNSKEELEESFAELTGSDDENVENEENNSPTDDVESNEEPKATFFTVDDVETPEAAEDRDDIEAINNLNGEENTSLRLFAEPENSDKVNENNDSPLIDELLGSNDPKDDVVPPAVPVENTVPNDAPASEASVAETPVIETSVSSNAVSSFTSGKDPDFDSMFEDIDSSDDVDDTATNDSQDELERIKEEAVRAIKEDRSKTKPIETIKETPKPRTTTSPKLSDEISSLFDDVFDGE